MANEKRTRIVGIGSALVDLLLQEGDDFIVKTGAQKGGMTLVDSSVIDNALTQSNESPAIVPGGSACNAILGVGKLGGLARFVGTRGNDQLGKLFEAGLKSHHVEPVLKVVDKPTGRVLSVITPDAQRTMYTFLGASQETRPAEMVPAIFADAAVVHIEGYLLFNRDLMFAACKAVKDAGAQISLDLASFTVVEASKDILEDLIREYVDILIANEDEAKAFTGESDELKSLEILAKKATIAVLKVGKRGAFISASGIVTKVDVLEGVRAIDTTGAGDLWAAGFLFGYVNGYSMEKAGKIASACGGEVCKVIGATIPEEGWERIRELL